MARDSVGKRVQRAGATGGSRTYRGQIPANWYAGLVVIVLIGLVSVIYSRHEYQHPVKATVVQPAVGTTWYAGIAFDLCGTEQPALAANTSSTGISTSGNGVMVIAPTKASQAGHNATLGKFVSGYKGLSLTDQSVGYPGSKALTDGDACAAGTPDAGKKGVVRVYSWHNVESKQATVVNGDPQDLVLGQSSLVTVTFAPAGSKPPNKSASVEVAVLQAAAAGSTSTSTTTTAPGATTTVPATTTTAPSGSTTTTAPSGTTTTAGG